MKRLDSLSLYAIFLVLNIIDAANTTYILLFTSGGYEFNPVINWLLEKSDTTLILWLWKIIILVLVGWVTKLTSKTKYEPRWWRILVAANALMIVVVLWGAYMAVTL